MGLLLFIVLVVVLELVIEGLEDEDRFAEDEDDYDIAAFTNNSIFSASRTLKWNTRILPHRRAGVPARPNAFFPGKRGRSICERLSFKSPEFWKVLRGGQTT